MNEEAVVTSDIKRTNTGMKVVVFMCQGGQDVMFHACLFST
jgi:hypothetical protein